MKYFYLVLFVVLFLANCANTEDKPSVCAGVNCGNGVCKNNNGNPMCDCNEGYHAENLICVTDNIDPCRNITCSNHGTCVNNAGIVTCDCYSGYKAEGLYCIPDTTDVCSGVTCSNQGTCSDNNGSAKCTCNTGYHSEGLNCIADVVDFCKDVTCSNHGSCSVVNNAAKCTCDTGYVVSGLQCIPESVDLCLNITCSNHGSCVTENGAAKCNCNNGYVAVGLECKEEANPCRDVTCSGNGTCLVQGDNAICDCNEGYHTSGLNCLQDENPCRGITCSNAGVCEVQGNQAVCNCQDGYFAQGLTCVPNPVLTVEWCNLQSPTSINANINEATTVYGQVLIRTITDTLTTPNANVKAQLGYSTSPIINQGTPIENLTWVNAAFNIKNFDNHEYKTDFNVTTAGTYYYIYRFSADNGTTWKYCGLRGVFSDDYGTANITQPGTPCDNVTCSNHGVCSISNNTATCVCDSGYTAEGTNCVENATPQVEWCNVWYPKSIVTQNSTIKTIYGQIFVPNITTEGTANANIKAELGVTMSDVPYPFNPEWFIWKTASFNVKFGNNHEYKADFNFEASGNYKYIYRFSADGGTHWTFCDVDGKVVNSVNPGTAVVSGPCDNVTCSDHGYCTLENGDAKCNCEDGYTANGTECVSAIDIQWCNLQFPLTINATQGDQATLVFGQVLINGITTQPNPQPQVIGKLGYTSSTANLTNPIVDSQFTWMPAEFNAVVGNNHEFKAAFPTTTAGTYKYIYKFSADAGQTWKYCDAYRIIQDDNLYYSMGIANISLPNSPCDGVDCGGHGICSVQDNNAVCTCDAGYTIINNPLNCEVETSIHIEWCNLQFPATITSTFNASKEIYGQVYIPAVTNIASSSDARVKAQFGYASTPIYNNPQTRSDITWVDAGFNAKVGNNHEYSHIWTFNEPGTFAYLYRFSVNNGQSWTYCDINGVVEENETMVTGVASITGYVVEWCKIWDPLSYVAETGTSQLISSQVFVPGITDVQTTSNDKIISQIAFAGSETTLANLPSLTWDTALFTQQSFNNHEYRYNKAFTQAGTHYYYYRFSADSGNSWKYCDKNGVITSTSGISGGVATITAPFNPCNNVTCSSHGSCEVVNNAASCVCESGYHNGTEPLTCEQDEVPTGATFHTILVDANPSDWKAEEMLGDGGVGITLRATWDATNLYLLVANKDFSTDANGTFEIYIDCWSGQGVNNGQNFALDHNNGVNARKLPTNFMADRVLSVNKNAGNFYDNDNYSGCTSNCWWKDKTFTGSNNFYNYLQTPYLEIVIPLSDLSVSSGSLISIYSFVTDSSSDYVYSTWPTTNIKGANNSVASENDKYYRFPLSANQDPNNATFIKP